MFYLARGIKTEHVFKKILEVKYWIFLNNIITCLFVFKKNVKKKLFSFSKRIKLSKLAYCLHKNSVFRLIRCSKIFIYLLQRFFFASFILSSHSVYYYLFLFIYFFDVGYKRFYLRYLQSRFLLFVSFSITL